MIRGSARLRRFMIERVHAGERLAEVSTRTRVRMDDAARRAAPAARRSSRSLLARARAVRLALAARRATCPRSARSRPGRVSARPGRRSPASWRTTMMGAARPATPAVRAHGRVRAPCCSIIRVWRSRSSSAARCRSARSARTGSLRPFASSSLPGHRRGRRVRGEPDRPQRDLAAASSARSCASRSRRSCSARSCAPTADRTRPDDVRRRRARRCARSRCSSRSPARCGRPRSCSRSCFAIAYLRRAAVRRRRAHARCSRSAARSSRASLGRAAARAVVVLAARRRRGDARRAAARVALVRDGAAVPHRAGGRRARAVGHRRGRGRSRSRSRPGRASRGRLRAWVLAAMSFALAWLPGRLSAGATALAPDGVLVGGRDRARVRGRARRRGGARRPAPVPLRLAPGHDDRGVRGARRSSVVGLSADTRLGPLRPARRRLAHDLLVDGRQRARRRASGCCGSATRTCCPPTPRSVGDVGFALTRNGVGDARASWAAPEQHADRVLAAMIDAAASGSTVRLGHLLAPGRRALHRVRPPRRARTRGAVGRDETPFERRARAPARSHAVARRRLRRSSTTTTRGSRCTRVGSAGRHGGADRRVRSAGRRGPRRKPTAWSACAATAGTTDGGRTGHAAVVGGRELALGRDRERAARRPQRRVRMDQRVRARRARAGARPLLRERPRPRSPAIVEIVLWLVVVVVWFATRRRPASRPRRPTAARAEAAVERRCAYEVAPVPLRRRARRADRRRRSRPGTRDGTPPSPAPTATVVAERVGARRVEHGVVLPRPAAGAAARSRRG